VWFGGFHALHARCHISDKIREPRGARASNRGQESSDQRTLGAGNEHASIQACGEIGAPPPSQQYSLAATGRVCFRISFGKAPQDHESSGWCVSEVIRSFAAGDNPSNAAVRRWRTWLARRVN